ESGDAGDVALGLVAGGLVAHLVLRVAGGGAPLVAEPGLERERAGGDADALLVAVEAVRFEEVAPEGVVDGVEVVLVGELGAGDLLGGVVVRHGSTVSPCVQCRQARSCTNFLFRAVTVYGSWRLCSRSTSDRNV